MARTQEGATLTREHLRNQLTVRRSVLADFSDVFPGWSLNDPGSFDDVARAGAVIATNGHRVSAGISADYFERFRDVEGVGGTVTPRIADPPSRDELREMIRANGLAGTVNARRRGQPMSTAMQNGLVRASGVVSTAALNGGRETIRQSINRDREARGWQRVTGDDPCAFCAMLASRGPAYRGQDTAHFEAHSHCMCSAEPAYQGSQPPPEAERFRDQWDEAQRRAREDAEWASRGTSNDQLNNFRRLIGK